MPRDLRDRPPAHHRSKPYNDPRKPGQKKPKSRPQEKDTSVSINDLKRRIRDVKRLLNRRDLPADARVTQERVLKGHERELEQEMARRARSEMIRKYHFVRFLERKTATKHLNRLLRREKEARSEEMKETLARRIHSARVDLNYTIYFPLQEKYVSLYPKGSETKDEEEEGEEEEEVEEETEKEQKPAMWAVVEKAMEEGTLESLRDGVSGSTSIEEKTEKKRKEKKKKEEEEEKAASEEEDGFFE
ncbi:hypothetical protein ASPZODRAFT_138428 [Penicilliopsis zonata CBS 506.65]|uniref:rRNA-processing protein EFG1 n=1 Tax=Penicilliopsis zonata CBS 506.65 TaxID=1073090 RepID=A0A1L9SW89_9EURO|nr:hypothetical protein ASPZODRAFT_138428 [Penicilliopsis zonata CBS 506.65]OJJ51323.1 hypothetical protein ASPZODRAFT_138428 [Penicilliopsis zonata CBS 506.65]